MKKQKFSNYEVLADGRISIGNAIVLCKDSIYKGFWRTDTGFYYNNRVYEKSPETKSIFPCLDHEEGKNYLKFEVNNDQIIAIYDRGRGEKFSLPILSILWVRDRIYNHAGYLLIGKDSIIYEFHVMEYSDEGRNGPYRMPYRNLDISVANIDALFEVVRVKNTIATDYPYDISLEQFIINERERCSKMETL